MTHTTFWFSTAFTLMAVIIFATSPAPVKLGTVVFPLLIFFSVPLNKRRKSINMRFSDILLAFIPYFGNKQLKQLYFATA